MMAVGFAYYGIAYAVDPSFQSAVDGLNSVVNSGSASDVTTYLEGSAPLMMKSKTLIKSLAENGEDSPAKILQKANIELSQGNDAEMFVTVWLGIYDFTTHILTTSNAGHEFPAVKHANAPFEFFHGRCGWRQNSRHPRRTRAHRLRPRG